MLTKSEAGYVAGIIDGEGSIVLALEHRGPYTTIHPQLKVSSTSRELAQYLRKRVGGQFGKYEHKNQPNWRPDYVWYLTSPRIIKTLLEEIEPFMVVKRKQGLLLLKWFRIRTDRRRTRQTNGIRPIPRNQLLILEKLHELTKTGKAVKAKARIEPLESPGPEYLGEEAA